MRLIVTEGVVWSVCLSVCRYVTILSPAETAEPIEMPFGMWTWVGPRNHVLCEGERRAGHCKVTGISAVIELCKKRLNRLR